MKARRFHSQRYAQQPNNRNDNWSPKLTDIHIPDAPSMNFGAANDGTNLAAGKARRGVSYRRRGASKGPYRPRAALLALWQASSHKRNTTGSAME